MGSQIACTATLHGQTSEGKALLETSQLQFRGAFRVKVPFGKIQSVKAEKGTLKVRFGQEELSLQLGEAAPKWASKILHPPTLADKLGIKGGETISLLGPHNEDFLRLVEDKATKVSKGRALKGSDLIFLAAEKKATLQKLERLKTFLKPAGAVWVIRPKGGKQISEMDVINAGKAAGLVDTKVAAFSPTHTAEKLVIPLRERR